MRSDCVVSVLSFLLSMATVMVVFGQHQQWILMTGQSVELDMQIEKVNAALEDRRFLKDLVQKQLEERKKMVVDLETEMANLAQDEQKKKADNEACQAEKKTKDEELAGKQKEKADTEAALKTETDAWNETIGALTKQIEQHSKVCEFVKDDPMARKLCDK
ncbi:uncharacterized protein LOC144542883 [Centroberyx gerrardi]